MNGFKTRGTPKPARRELTPRSEFYLRTAGNTHGAAFEEEARDIAEDLIRQWEAARAKNGEAVVPVEKS